MAAAKKSGGDSGGKHKFMFGISEDDRKLLDEVVNRYRKVCARPNKTWVLRQLIRSTYSAKKLPPVLGPDFYDLRKMMVGFSDDDMSKLNAIVERYDVAAANKTWVLRQLIRNAHAAKSLPAVVVSDDD